MTELLFKQFKLVELLPKLIDKAHSLGFNMKLGECARGEVQAVANSMTSERRAFVVSMIAGVEPALGTALRGIRGTPGILNSLHRVNLAVDIMLFVGAEWVTDSAKYTALGEYWESLDPECRWGGRFTRPDGGHFSIAWDGRA